MIASLIIAYKTAQPTQWAAVLFSVPELDQLNLPAFSQLLGSVCKSSEASLLLSPTRPQPVFIYPSSLNLRLTVSSQNGHASASPPAPLPRETILAVELWSCDNTRYFCHCTVQVERSKLPQCLSSRPSPTTRCRSSAPPSSPPKSSQSSPKATPSGHSSAATTQKVFWTYSAYSQQLVTSQRRYNALCQLDARRLCG